MFLQNDYKLKVVKFDNLLHMIFRIIGTGSPYLNWASWGVNSTHNYLLLIFLNRNIIFLTDCLPESDTRQIKLFPLLSKVWHYRTKSTQIWDFKNI